jgi:hypothetical protein
MAKHLEIDDEPAFDSEPQVNPAPYGLKKDGTPKGAPGRPKINVRPTEDAQAGPPLRRNNPRPPLREQTREPSREPTREASTILGRNGEELKRRRPNASADIFDRVRPPAGWSYQWNPVSHLNKEIEEIQKSISVDMYENGWRPVPASRHPGIYTPAGYEGAIIVKGQRLEERPEAMTKAAIAEDTAYARAQLRTQTDALRFKQSQLPGANERNVLAASGIKMQIDRSFDLPPSSDYDTGGE